MLDSPLLNPAINVKATMNSYRNAIIKIDKQIWYDKVWDDTGNTEKATN